MARLTPLPLADAIALGREYGLDVTAVEPLDAGSVNSNFELATSDGGRFFARIYEEQGMEGAAGELRLLEALAGAGVPTTEPLRRAGGGPARYGGKPVAVYPWIEGEILCQRRVTVGHCERVGRALADLHLSTPSLGTLPRGRFNISDIAERLTFIEKASAEFAPAARSISTRLSSYAERRATDLPRGIVHGDLFRDNVLWKDDRIAALIDFESASEDSFAFDVMVTLEAWCYGQAFEVPLVRAFLSGYHAVRPLTDKEVDALVVEGAIAALRFATTRITDFSMRAAPGTPPGRDYRRFLARLDALEGGVLTPVQAELRG